MNSAGGHGSPIEIPANMRAGNIGLGVEIGAYAWRIGTDPELREHVTPGRNISVVCTNFLRLYRISRMSSKYIVPAPPAAGLPLVPMPMVIVLTLARFTPANA